MKSISYFELALYKKDDKGEIDETLPPIHSIKIDAKYYYALWGSQIHSYYLNMFQYIQKNNYNLDDYKIRLRQISVEPEDLKFTNEEIKQIKEIIQEKYGLK